MNLTVEPGPSTLDHWPQPLQDAMLDGLAFISRVFWGPDLEFCLALHRGDGLEFLEEPLLERIFASSGDTAAEIYAVARLCGNAEALYENLEAEYVTLFISNRQGIAAPLYHSCYTQPEGPDSPAMLMGEPALEMEKRLASTGLALAKDLNEPPDHLCIEIEYLYFLLKEGWTGKGKALPDAGQTFAGDWMLPWGRQFRDQVKAVEKDGLYSLVSSLLVELLEVISDQT